MTTEPTAAEKRAIDERIARDVLGWTWQQLGQVMCWFKPSGGYGHATFTTDANVIDAAIREWCGEDEWDGSKVRWRALYREFIGVVRPHCKRHIVTFGDKLLATPLQKSLALLSAYDSLKEGGA